MDLELDPGVYVVAVSGGVDSVALLHYLQSQPNLKLTVAHFDHGIRGDSEQDRKLVARLAQGYNLPFVFSEGRLGLGASEAVAREARYRFLREVAATVGARAIVTAHHQDDIIETAIINILRGTGRKGLTSLGSSHDFKRPVAHISKPTLVAYAKDNGLVWREDSTNMDQRYLRNYVRHNLANRIVADDRQNFLQNVDALRQTNEELDELLTQTLKAQLANNTIDRNWFIQLPHAVAKEIIATWLRTNGIRDFDKKTLERLVVAAKTGRSGAAFDVLHGVRIWVGIDSLALRGNER